MADRVKEAGSESPVLCNGCSRLPGGLQIVKIHFHWQKQKQERSKKHKVVGKPSDQVEGKKSGMAVVPKVGDVTTTHNVQQTSKPVECFICQGSHRVKDCPRREKLSALQNTKEDDLDSDNPSPQLNPLQVVTTLYTPTFFIN